MKSKQLPVTRHKGGFQMIPTIDRRATGVNIRRIMDKRNISVKDLQHYLGLGSIQSIYHWLNGICLPSLDNLYAMSRYFRLPIDDLICGTGPLIHFTGQVCYPSFIFWEFFTSDILTARFLHRVENYFN